MQHSRIPYFTIVIAFLTFFMSFYVAYDISGSLFGRVRIFQLEPYGGIRFHHLMDLEVWRLFVSQLIHVKQYHMLYNVLSFAFLGVLIERKIGSARAFALWFVAGAAGTLFSTLFVKHPFNLGTGASQAILSLAGLGCMFIYHGVDTSKVLKFAVGFSIVPALMLDLIYAHYLKPGHVLSLVLGLFFGQVYLRTVKQRVNLVGPDQ